ncbi:MAG TPA: hypothetical protein VNT20_18310 [Flavisolibacter sp.]|jgi:hypothetical protein|nr:hypothetical protein [Flavisolibacter sp.]
MVKDLGKQVIGRYFKMFGSDAPKPEDPPVIRKKYVVLSHAGKKLCRYNIESGVFDQLSRAVKKQVKLIEENIELRKKLSTPFPFKKEMGEEFNYFQVDYNSWLKCDPNTNQLVSLIKIANK